MNLVIERTIRLPDGKRLHLRRRPAAGMAKYTLLLLHGWPGSADDWSPVLAEADRSWLDTVEILVPELRGFGRSAAAASDQPAGLAAHMTDLHTVLQHTSAGDVVVAGYDLGASLAQELARQHDVVGLVLGCPPYPGIGQRRYEPQVQAELWYQYLHQQPWADSLIAHDRTTLEIYLRHFYTHWWGSGTVAEDHFQTIVERYQLPGALRGSIDWYRARATGRPVESGATPAPIVQPTEVLWGGEDPVNPARFADRLNEFFPNAALRILDGIGHFIPIEAPDQLVAALRRLHRRLGFI